MEDLPAAVCPQCGEKVVKADVGRWITKLLENPDLHLEIDSFKLAIEVKRFRYREKDNTEQEALRSCIKKGCLVEYGANRNCTYQKGR